MHASTIHTKGAGVTVAVALLLVLVGLAPPATHAGRVVNVDYGDGAGYQGQGALGTGGPFWNVGALASPPQSTSALFDLKDSWGDPTGILAVVAAQQQGLFGQGTFSSTNTNALTEDFYVYPNAQTPWTLSIQQLDPQRRYTLVVYGYRAQPGNAGTDFEIGGVEKTTSGNPAGVGGGFSLGDTHVVFDDVAPDANGQILVTMGPGNDETNAFLNGFQLEESDGLVIEIAPNEEQLLDWSRDENDDDDTGIRIKNLSNASGTVGMVFRAGDGLGPGESVAPGFAIVDGTLEVASDIAPGELRVRYRVEYARASIRATGIRASEVRMMRLDEGRARWGRAIRARRSPVRGRYLRDARADFVLGHHGFSRSGRYAWAVLDVNSEYSVGGPLQSEALPVGPAVMIGLGASLMGAGAWASRRR